MRRVRSGVFPARQHHPELRFFRQGDAIGRIGLTLRVRQVKQFMPIKRAAQAKTREQQEAASRKVADIPPTINFDFNDDDWSINPFTTPGQPIEVAGEPDIDVDFTPEYTETFVISGGMDSPMVFAGEEEDTFSLSGVQDYGYGVYYGGGEDE